MGYFNDRRKRETISEEAARVPVNTAEKTGSPQGTKSGRKSVCTGEKLIDSGAYKTIPCSAACVELLPASELSAERDFRMLQGMYPNQAKELLELIEEECDRLEYEGSPMFDEYPDYTTIYTLQKRIEDAARKKTGTIRDETRKKAGATRDDAGAAPIHENEGADRDSVPDGLIRVMLLQEMHRRRSRYRACRGVNML